MKRLTLHRLASALLCLTLALSLTACGGKKKPAPAAGNGGVKGPVSSSKTDQTGQADPVKPSEPEAEVDQELVEECLDKLGFDLEYGGYPGAAAYLGYREKGDTSKLSDWLLENCGVVGTPGVGFGECGEGYFRLTAFGDAEKTKTAAERIKAAIKAL